MTCPGEQLGGSGKTISNMHGFVSGAFKAAVRAGVMASNPCEGRRLPHTRVDNAANSIKHHRGIPPAEFRERGGRELRERRHVVPDDAPTPQRCTLERDPQSVQQRSGAGPCRHAVETGRIPLSPVEATALTLLGAMREATLYVGGQKIRARPARMPAKSWIG